MTAETLDGDFYRSRAELCIKLAASAEAARPLFSRLYFLAEAYKAKAKEADLYFAGGRIADKAKENRQN
jgi:hypothetical protein